MGFANILTTKKKCIPEKIYLCRNESFVLTNLARPCFQKFTCCLITRLNGKQIKEQINKPFQKNIGLEKKVELINNHKKMWASKEVFTLKKQNTAQIIIVTPMFAIHARKQG